MGMLERNKLCKYGLDSKATKLILEGYSDTEVHSMINQGLPSEKRVPLGDICQWRNEVERSGIKRVSK